MMQTLGPFVATAVVEGTCGWGANEHRRNQKQLLQIQGMIWHPRASTYGLAPSEFLDLHVSYHSSCEMAIPVYHSLVVSSE